MNSNLYITAEIYFIIKFLLFIDTLLQLSKYSYILYYKRFCSLSDFTLIIVALICHYLWIVFLEKAPSVSFIKQITRIKICKNINKKQHIKLSCYILEIKGQHLLREQRVHFFILKEKRALIFKGLIFFMLL